VVQVPDRLAIGVGHLIELLYRFGQGLGQRRRVTFISALNRHGHDRARVRSAALASRVVASMAIVFP